MMGERRYWAAMFAFLLGCAGKGATSAQQAPPPSPVATAPAASPAPPGASTTSAPPTRGPKLIPIPGGSLEMGSNDPKSDSNERPAHRVEVKPFEMDATEVTVADFRACAEAGACEATATIETLGGFSADARRAYEPSCNAGQAGRDVHPMNCVDWTQASAYCKWAGKRLPTEEEWELAARGAEGRLYPWGDAAPDEALVNACDPSCQKLMVSRGFASVGQAGRREFTRDDGFPETAPVGSFPAGRSPFGLFDMAGNVSEWTSSEYCSYVDGTCSAELRAIRGHSWLDDYPRWFSGTARTAAVPPFRHSNLGFRCAR